MKKLITIFLAFLMVILFIGCKNDLANSSSEEDIDDNQTVVDKPTDDSQEPDIDNEEPVIETPVLPESKGDDPFEAYTELKYVNSDFEKILVNTENKTMITACTEDDVWTNYSEFNYSYEVNNDDIIISVVKTKMLDADNNLVPLQTFINNINTYYEKSIELLLSMFFDLYDKNNGDASFEEVWLNYIKYFNNEFSTSFTVENFKRENIDSLVKEALATEKVKIAIAEHESTIKKESEAIMKFKVNIQGNEGTTALIKIEGLYDDSKKWYEQTSGIFKGLYDGGGDILIDGEISFPSGYIHCEIYSYDWDLEDSVTFITNYSVTSVDESQIQASYYDDNNEFKTINFDYTTQGTGKDTIVKMNYQYDAVLELKWKSKTTL